MEWTDRQIDAALDREIAAYEEWVEAWADEAPNPWADDYTAPGEAMLRSYCEEEPESEGFDPVAAAWFRPCAQACVGVQS